jgi:hypothetical protein
LHIFFALHAARWGYEDSEFLGGEAEGFSSGVREAGRRARLASALVPAAGGRACGGVVRLSVLRDRDLPPAWERSRLGECFRRAARRYSLDPRGARRWDGGIPVGPGWHELQVPIRRRRLADGDDCAGGIDWRQSGTRRRAAHSPLRPAEESSPENALGSSISTRCWQRGQGGTRLSHVARGHPTTASSASSHRGITWSQE